MNASVVGQNKRLDKNCTGKYSRWLRDQNGEHIINIWESNISETQVTRTLFPGESTNDIKIKITQHRVTRDEYIWEGVSLTNTCWVSQSVFYQVLVSAFASS